MSRWPSVSPQISGQLCVLCVRSVELERGRCIAFELVLPGPSVQNSAATFCLQQWGSKWLPSNWHFWEKFVRFHLCITCSSLSQNLCKHIASGTNYYLTESHPGQNTLPGSRSGSSLMFQAHQLQQRKPQSQHNWTAHPLPLSLPWHLDHFACRQASTGVNKKNKTKKWKALFFLLFFALISWAQEHRPVHSPHRDAACFVKGAVGTQQPRLSRA